MLDLGWEPAAEGSDAMAYANYISLGYFCGVAEDLERLGLRNQSLPFDWMLTELPQVMAMLDNEFSGFMEFENLAQNTHARNHYHDKAYDYYSFHDFNRYDPLAEQLPVVRKKFERRIERLLTAIRQPTLFLRYISTEELTDDGRSVELEWLEANLDRVRSTLTRFNPDNEIWFIGDESVHSDAIRLFNVVNDEGRKVCRKPIYGNPELLALLSAVDLPGRAENAARYERKQAAKAKGLDLKGKIQWHWQRTFVKDYLHPVTYSIPDK